MNTPSAAPMRNAPMLLSYPPIASGRRRRAEPIRLTAACLAAQTLHTDVLTSPIRSGYRRRLAREHHGDARGLLSSAAGRPEQRVGEKICRERTTPFDARSLRPGYQTCIYTFPAIAPFVVGTVLIKSRVLLPSLAAPLEAQDSAGVSLDTRSRVGNRQARNLEVTENDFRRSTRSFNMTSPFKQGGWTVEEDRLLRSVLLPGPGQTVPTWAAIAQLHFSGEIRRNANQLRHRWVDVLRDGGRKSSAERKKSAADKIKTVDVEDLEDAPFSVDEDRLILHCSSKSRMTGEEIQLEHFPERDLTVVESRIVALAHRLTPSCPLT